MSQDQSSNKRIAKNTVMLYIRMFITLLIGLYTSRVILNALGVEDYGVYNVVGGFVGLFGMVSGCLSIASSRFITFELGRGNLEEIRKVFATSSIVQIAISVIVVMLAETIGLWFFYHKMVIPEERLFAALIVFQLSIVSFVVGLLYVPYNAAIIAHEEMGKFAMFSIVESVAKLIIVLIVQYAETDRLILYASLICLVSWSMSIMYITYCKRHFAVCTFHYTFDKALFLQMFGFAGWYAIGSTAGTLRNQGATILLNLFGGLAVNTAAGIALTLTGVLDGFVSNFSISYSPQITKTYAAGDYSRLNNLMLIFSRLSFYLVLFFALPVFLNAHFIISLWLGIVPGHTVVFVRLVIIVLLFEVLSRPLITANNATGNIRDYQLVVNGILLLSLPSSYIALRLGASIEIVYISNAVFSAFAYMARFIMLRRNLAGWSVRRYFSRVCIKVLTVTCISVILPLYLYLSMDEGWMRTIFSSLASVIAVFLSVYFCGLSAYERVYLSELIKSRLRVKIM